jgi:pimeloyl-ACP methyl ester carboxylesterase
VAVLTQRDQSEIAAFRDCESELYAEFGQHPQERILTVPGSMARFRVVELDGDRTRPPVVMLHGITSVTAAAIPLLPAMAGRRILAIDTPGHGLSDPFRIPSGVDVGRRLAGLIPAVLDDVGEERADVVAHSLGGQISLRTALAHPDRIRRLVLLGAPGAAFAGVQPVTAMRAFAIPGVGTAILRMPTSLESYARNATAVLGAQAAAAQTAKATEAGWHASRRPGFASSLASFFRALLSARGVRPGVALTPAELASIRVPTMHVWGEDDVFLTPSIGAAEFERIPGGVLHRMRGGHAPWLDDPEAVASLVHDFLHDDPPAQLEESA